MTAGGENWAREQDRLAIMRVTWLGLLASASGVVLGLMMAGRREESASVLPGLAVAALSVAVGCLLWLLGSFLTKRLAAAAPAE